MFSGSQHTTVAAASQAGYEPVKGFAPITFLFNSVVALASHPDLIRMPEARQRRLLQSVRKAYPDAIVLST